MILQFYNLAIENKIVLFCLSSHSIPLTQPLNIRVFQLFKYYHTDTTDKAIQLSNEKFGKLEFFAAFLLFCN